MIRVKSSCWPSDTCTQRGPTYVIIVTLQPSGMYVLDADIHTPQRACWTRHTRLDLRKQHCCVHFHHCSGDPFF